MSDFSEYDKIILGIDPGTNIMGYGLIGCNRKEFSLIAMSAIQLDKYDNHAIKLKKIFDKVIGLIDNFHPDELSIEAPFYGKNVQSMLKLGRAQGVAIAAGLNRELPIFEYSPKKIKQSITGSGNASKEQVASMLQNLLKFTEMPNNLDATDGLAAAVCHFFQNKPRGFGEKTTKNSWASFVAENKNRIKE
jgi:crossover junction endodeoxyribonuclease RuvC